jgi:hypothetical protein
MNLIITEIKQHKYRRRFMKSRDKTKKLLLLAMLMLSTMLITLPAYADDTGLKSPASCATGTTGNPPTNPGQALVDDVATGVVGDASCALFKTNNSGGGGGVADSEIYDGFTFSIPSGATIDGIEVVVSGYRTGSTSVGAYFRVRLDGGSGWTAYKDTPVLTTTDAEYILGGSGDGWSGSWSADGLDADFRLEVIPAGPYLNGELWKLDSVSVTVYYTVTVADFEGLSHGYWKSHTEDWTDYSPSDTLESVFDIPDSFGLDSYTLDQALDFHGGDTVAEKAQILLRNAVASVLNAAHPNINYPLTLAEVIEEVNAAVATENAATMGVLEAILDGYNNLGPEGLLD